MLADKEEAVKGKIREVESVRKQLAGALANGEALREELKGMREQRDAAAAASPTFRATWSVSWCVFPGWPWWWGTTGTWCSW